MLIILSFQRGKLFLCACPAVHVCLCAVPLYVRLPLFTQQVAIIDFGACVLGRGGGRKGTTVCPAVHVHERLQQGMCFSHAFSSSFFMTVNDMWSVNNPRNFIFGPGYFVLL